MNLDARIKEMLTERQELQAEQKKLIEVFLAAPGNPDGAKLRKAADRLDVIEKRISVLKQEWTSYKAEPLCEEATECSSSGS